MAEFKRKFTPNRSKTARRAVLHSLERQATGTNTALAVATQIGKEFRVFQNMTFWGRVKWLVTGQITVSEKIRETLLKQLNDVENEE